MAKKEKQFIVHVETVVTEEKDVPVEIFLDDNGDYISVMAKRTDNENEIDLLRIYHSDNYLETFVSDGCLSELDLFDNNENC